MPNTDYIVFAISKKQNQTTALHGDLEKELKNKAANGYEVVSIKFTKTTTEQREHPAQQMTIAGAPNNPPPNTFSPKSTYYEEITGALVVMKKS